MILVVVSLWLLRDEPYRADLSDDPLTPSARAGAAAGVVQDLVRALEAGDATAAASLAADAGTAEQLQAAAANARDLRLDELSARYVDEIGAVSSDGSWSAAVAITWAIDGFDREQARAEVLMAFTPTADGVAMTGIGGGDRISPLWLRERLAVRRTPEAIVMVGGDQAARLSRTYLQRVRRAIPIVRRVLPQWRASVVVEVPASAAQVDDALDVSDGTYADIAAVTAGADGSSRSQAPVRVFVNPEVTGRLRGAGAQVVMSHEVVHVATNATTTDLDPWLLEGFADYVALRDVDLPVDITAARAIANVRRGGAPDRLPGVAEFDTEAVNLEATYELAWLACVEVADQVGERGLVRVYNKAAAGATTRDALSSVGLTTADVVRGWQQRLRGLTS